MIAAARPNGSQKGTKVAANQRKRIGPLRYSRIGRCGAGLSATGLFDFKFVSIVPIGNVDHNYPNPRGHNEGDGSHCAEPEAANPVIGDLNGKPAAKEAGDGSSLSRSGDSFSERSLFAGISRDEGRVAEAISAE